MHDSRFRVVLLSLYAIAINEVTGFSELYPFGPGEDDVALPPNDDGGSPGQTLVPPFPFFGRNRASLFVMTNGLLSFDSPFGVYTPQPFPLTRTGVSVVAPFWADAIITDGRADQVYYRTTTDSELLSDASYEINLAFMPGFQARWGFLATWVNVTFFGSNNFTVNNTFQVALLSDGQYSFSIFKYVSIMWTTGTASGGDSNTGLGGSAARAGFDAGDGVRFYSLPGSATSTVVDIEGTTNVGKPGMWILRLDGAEIDNGKCLSDGIIKVSPRLVHPFAGVWLAVNGPCFNETDSIICRFHNVSTRGFYENQETVFCSTPFLLRNRKVQLQVSADNGTTFPYSIFLYTTDANEGTGVFLKDEAMWTEVIEQKLTYSSSEIAKSRNVSKVDVYVVVMNNPNDEPIMHPLVLNVNNTGEVDIKNAFQAFLGNEGLYVKSIGAFAVLPANSSSPLRLDTIWTRRLFLGRYTWNVQTHAILHCTEWFNQDTWTPNDLQPCPCTSNQATRDNSFVPDNQLLSFLHPGAAVCYRSLSANPSGDGQECCYDSSGNLLNVADDAAGGGTVDRYHPVEHYWKHQWNDIYPYVMCCILSPRVADCSDKYMQKRPSDDCSDYEPPNTGWTGGDPHFFTLDKFQYTYNGQGDHLLYEDGQGARVEVRLVPVAGTAATKIQAIACRDNASSSVQVQALAANPTLVRVDGLLQDFSSAPVQDFTGVRVTQTSNTTINIHLLTSNVIMGVSSAFQMLSLNFTLPRVAKENTRGLVGTWNDNSTDDLMTQNGTVLSTNSSAVDIHNVFGSSWRVINSSLFTSPEHLENNYTPAFNITPSAAAQAACQGNEFCEFDYMTTGNPAIANATLAAAQEVVATAAALTPVVSCGYLPSPYNGERRYNNTLEGSLATFSCNSGYELAGSTTRQCSSTRAWTGQQPACINIVTSTVPTTTIRAAQQTTVTTTKVTATATENPPEVTTAPLSDSDDNGNSALVIALATSLPIVLFSIIGLIMWRARATNPRKGRTFYSNGRPVVDRRGRLLRAPGQLRPKPGGNPPAPMFRRPRSVDMTRPTRPRQVARPRSVDMRGPVAMPRSNGLARHIPRPRSDNMAFQPNYHQNTPLFRGVMTADRRILGRQQPGFNTAPPTFY